MTARVVFRRTLPSTLGRLQNLAQHQAMDTMSKIPLAGVVDTDAAELCLPSACRDEPFQGENDILHLSVVSGLPGRAYLLVTRNDK